MLALWALPAGGLLMAQPQEEAWEIEGLRDQSWVEWSINGTAIATNGVIVKYGGTVLTAEQATINQTNGEVTAQGQVRIEHDDMTWVGEHIVYNFKTHQMQAEQFRAGMPPVFIEGEGLHGELTNRAYAATNAYVTTDDIYNPAFKVRAKYIRVIPGKKILARHATLYLEGVPVFYFPIYSRNLGAHANNFNLMPGYRSIFGPYLLTSYTWFLNNELDGQWHTDYYERRGPGVGPTFNYHLGPWGDGTLKAYYLRDQDPSISATNHSISNSRERVYFSYLAMPATNLEIRSLVRYQGDSNIVREFFEGDYRQNPQPNTYLEVNKFWQNFSLDTYAQPRLNNFLETVERLPDVRLTGYRQELGASPFYYESQSSAGYYRRLFVETNGIGTGTNYEAARADTFHQILLPHTFFGWLNVTPRVGGRFTWYSEASGPGATTDEESRGVFNTGIEANFKASRLWPEFRSGLLQMEGLRHIIEPSVNYAFVPKPNVTPNQLPQFDYELPSLRLLPIDFPQYNNIDSIDSENTIRFALGNKIQTKRNGEVVNVANWSIYTDWNLHPRSNQSTFSDFYSDLTVRPRSWLVLESLARYHPEDGTFRMAAHSVTIEPSDRWSWSIGQFYLRDDLRPTPTALGIGNNLFTSVITYRLNENWGVRALQRFEASNGTMQEQAYTVYRDMRSWTAALTLRVLQNTTGPLDYTVAFTFSLKAFPRFGLGTDTGRPYTLLGG
ncbi:Organic solvent tolerance protein [Verrucomicrobia bacterium]|nr:Organic solvent tolerance protein [Verrucomicrobiota bacterium]